MEDLIKYKLNQWYRKSHWLYVIAYHVGFLLLLAAVLWLGWWLFFSGESVWSDVVSDMIAAMIGFLITFVDLRLLFLLSHRNEDKNKVSYANSDMWKQYGHNYREQFFLHNSVCTVYFEKMFVNTPDKKVVVEDDPNHFFELDSFIKSQFFDLIEAHAMSDTTNSITVRLKDMVETQDGRVVLSTMRSTYLAHMLTNRALDYELKPGITIRSLFENTDTLIPLQRSRLSNHLGDNALVFLPEGNNKHQWLLLPERGKHATVAKENVTASIATRVKMEKFANDYRDMLTSEYITEGCIKDSIADAIQAVNPVIAEIRLLGLSRDIYEGGKPTLFYVVYLNWSTDDYTEAHKEYIRLKKEKLQLQKQQEREGKIPLKKESIDEVETVHIVEWESVKMDSNAPSTIEPYLQFYPKKYDKALLEFADKAGQIRSKGFEQNLIANFWFLSQRTPDVVNLTADNSDK